jgi:hypothetical protein
MDMQIQARSVLTAVGSEADFREATASFGSFQGQAELALARMVAYAYASYWKGGADKAWAIDHIRETVKLAKDQARRLGNALTRITRTPLADGESPAKAALKFGNEFVADFYQHETKTRLAKREAAKAKQVEAAKSATEKAKAEEKRIREEAKAEARAEIGEEEIEGYEFVLCGEEGQMIPLTPEQFTYLAIHLADIRQSHTAAQEAMKKASREDHARMAAA